jgi:hypothetical protein
VADLELNARPCPQVVELSNTTILDRIYERGFGLRRGAAVAVGTRGLASAVPADSTETVRRHAAYARRSEFGSARCR